MADVKFVNQTERIPVKTLYCIGRNYAAHASELNNPIPSAPIVFIKPATTIISDGGDVVIPAASNDVHHEVEIVVLIGKAGKNIAVETAREYIAGYAVGIDVTARDIQSRAKEKSHPWAVAKGYDTFAPLSEFVAPDAIGNPDGIQLSLNVNGETRQDGNSTNMLFPIPQLIAYLSGIFTLQPGDLIFTGTPEGVAKMSAGDEVTASLENGLTTLTVGVKGSDS